MLRTTLAILPLVCGAGLASAEPAAGGAIGAPTAAPTALSAGPTAAPAAGRPTGLAVGVELGQPSSVTVGWFGLGGWLGADVALGTGTWSGTGLALRGDVALTPLVARLGAMRLLGHATLGFRYRKDHYAVASVDEVPDAHAGIRAAVSVGLAPTRALEAYLEVAPGYDVWRSDSCTFASGVDTLCPHARSSRGFVDLVVGARWYFEL